ncbi:MAG: hypothetical protein DBX67_04470, partial [Desulfovibrionaceae bacterium]
CLGSETVWRPGTPLTVDMAFNFEGYGTDKTQTYWAGGPDSMPAEARRAYDLCVEVQRAAAASLRPGVVPSRIWRDVLDRVGDTPFAAGFMGLDGNQVPFRLRSDCGRRSLPPQRCSQCPPYRSREYRFSAPEREPYRLPAVRQSLWR